MLLRLCSQHYFILVMNPVTFHNIVSKRIENNNNIVSKRIEKIEKYANLSIELKELWGMKTVETIQLVIGCTGTVDKKFVDYADKFPVQLSIGELQKITILGT